MSYPPTGGRGGHSRFSCHSRHSQPQYRDGVSKYAQSAHDRVSRHNSIAACHTCLRFGRRPARTIRDCRPTNPDRCPNGDIGSARANRCANLNTRSSNTNQCSDYKIRAGCANRCADLDADSAHSDRRPDLHARADSAVFSNSATNSAHSDRRPDLDARSANCNPATSANCNPATSAAHPRRRQTSLPLCPCLRSR